MVGRPLLRLSSEHPPPRTPAGTTRTPPRRLRSSPPGAEMGSPRSRRSGCGLRTTGSCSRIPVWIRPGARRMRIGRTPRPGAGPGGGHSRGEHTAASRPQGCRYPTWGPSGVLGSFRDNFDWVFRIPCTEVRPPWIGTHASAGRSRASRARLVAHDPRHGRRRRRAAAGGGAARAGAGCPAPRSGSAGRHRRSATTEAFSLAAAPASETAGRCSPIGACSARGGGSLRGMHPGADFRASSSQSPR